MNLINIERNLFYWFYPLLFIVCLFQAMNVIPPGLPGEGIYVWPFRLFVLYLGGKAFFQYNTKCPIFLVYFIYSFLSVILYISNDYPLHLYFTESAFSLTTYSFFFLGLDNKIDDSKFYKVTTVAIVVMFLIGLYLYFMPPSWYQTAWVRRMSTKWYLEGVNISFEHVSENMRFSSFWLTSYSTEYFGIFALPFSLYFMSISKTKILRICYVVSAVIILICVILSMQRAAILGCFIVLTLFLVYDFTHKRNGLFFYFFVFIMSICLVVSFGDSELAIRIFERFNSIDVDAAFGGTRASQNEDAYAALQNIVIGSGIGTCGSMARRIGLPAVTDSNYMKILFEQGIVGILIFFILIFKSLLKVKKNFRFLFAEGAIVCCYLIAMLGSNALSFSWFCPLFWFSLGRIWNKKYIDNLYTNDLGI